MKIYVFFFGGRNIPSFTGHLICSFSIFEAIKKKLHKIDFLLIFCIFRRLEIAILNSKVVMCVKTDNLWTNIQVFVFSNLLESFFLHFFVCFIFVSFLVLSAVYCQLSTVRCLLSDVYCVYCDMSTIESCRACVCLRAWAADLYCFSILSICPPCPPLTLLRHLSFSSHLSPNTFNFIYQSLIIWFRVAENTPYTDLGVKNFVPSTLSDGTTGYFEGKYLEVSGSIVEKYERLEFLQHLK